MLRLLFCDGLMSFATGSSQQQVRPCPLCCGGLNLSQSRVTRNCSGQLLVALEHVYEVLRSDEPSEPAKLLLNNFAADFTEHAAANGFHIDHVYPRSKMTERRLLARDVSPEHAHDWPDLRDDLANLQLLQGGPNQAKSDSDFDEWLDDQFGDSTKKGYFLAMHHFFDWSSFPYTQFGEFVAEREAILKKYLEKVLG